MRESLLEGMVVVVVAVAVAVAVEAVAVVAEAQEAVDKPVEAETDDDRKGLD